MFYINPNDFDGCLDIDRIDISSKMYKPEGYKSIKFGSLDSGNGSYLKWDFTTQENRDKAVEKIDDMIKSRELAYQINEASYRIQQAIINR